MWPIINSKDGKGIKFQERFWHEWGPSKMFYFNSELFNDEKEIKSIYFLYLNHNNIEFNPNEIALGLTYECSEFGEHTVLFSYEEIPKISSEYNSWNHYVLPHLETDIDLLVNLYNNKKLTDEEKYLCYLEDNIIDYDGDKETFKKLFENVLVLKAITGNKEKLYKKMLEDINLRLLVPDILIQFRKEMRQILKDSNALKFTELILNIMNTKIENGLTTEDVRNNYQKNLSFLKKEEQETNNDLNAIFQNCRTLFVDKYSNIENDKETDEMKIIEGKVIKNADGKALLEPINQKKYIIKYNN